MFRLSLKTFLVMSLMLHTALFAVAGLLQTEDMITKPEPIKVGVISRYKDPGAGKVESVKPSPKEPVKPVIKKKQITKKKETAKQVNRLVSDENKDLDEQTSELEYDVVADTGFSERVNEADPEGTGLDVEGTGRGVEIGYPDYKVNPKPSYPMIARRNGYEGAVLLNVFVLGNGRVGKIELEKSSGYEMLDKSALEAVKDWVFVPGKRNGAPIPSWVTVPIRFQLTSG